MKRIILFLMLVLVPAVDGLVISEIMYDLDGKDTKREWIEVYAKEETNLEGWKFYEAETNHRLKLVQGSFVLQAGERAIIADNNQSFLADNSDFSGALLDSSFSLLNTGEDLAIKDAEGTVVDEIFYNVEPGAAGDGNSLQLVDEEWLACLPTPGEENKCEVEDSGPVPPETSPDETSSSSPEEESEEEEIEEDEEEVEEVIESQPLPEPEPVEITAAVVSTPEPEVIVVYESKEQSNLMLPIFLLLLVSLLVNVLLLVRRK